MTKVTLSKGTTTFPMPAAVISVGVGEDANLITLAYVGKVCLNPPIIAIGINTKRHSFKLIEQHAEFVINYPTNGRDVNKWDALKLTKEKGNIVQVPLVKEFPWNMECKVIKKLELGSHVCFFGEVVAVHCDQKYLKKDSIDPDKLNTFAYISGKYIELKKGILGSQGFSLN
jgi:flavin reductase (DIM6/NTAB) family NADH-FMN oxidoreductase RutF